MKKIKKLSLNKEVVSILGGNDMNLVKGGAYTDYPCGTAGAGGTGGGGYVAVNDAIPPIKTPPPLSVAAGSCQTCVGMNTCGICPVIQNPPPPPAGSGFSCQGSCFQEQSCYPCGDM